MGKCLGCDKKLGLLEGYETSEGELCKDCYSKRNEILGKIKIEKESKHKEKINIENKNKIGYEKVRRILNKYNSTLLRELIKESVNSISKEKTEELVKRLKTCKYWEILNIILFFGLVIFCVSLNIGGTPYFLILLILIPVWINRWRKRRLEWELIDLVIIRQ
jgi:hypothetical protein